MGFILAFFLLGEDFGSVKCIVIGRKCCLPLQQKIISIEQNFHFHLEYSSFVKIHDTYSIDRDEFDRVICRPDIQYTSIKGTVIYWLALPRSLGAAEKRNMVVCTFFQQGRCRFGGI